MQPHFTPPPARGSEPARPDAQMVASAPFITAMPTSSSGAPPVPTAPAAVGLTPSQSDQPVPVVRVLSTRGVEYGMMTIALWVSAATLAWIMLNLLNGSKGFDPIVVPTAALVVCLPVFAGFFLRLKRAELVDRSLRLEPSKRRWSQTTQFLAFLALLINFIYFVYTILQHFSSDKGPSVKKSLINLIVILVIAGGTLAYYWRDEHRRES